MAPKFNIDPRTSVSVYLLVEACDLRNPQTTHENSLLTLRKRVFGEICFAGLLVLATVEAIVRALFALPGYLIGLCCNKEAQQSIHNYTLIGAKMALAALCGSAVGLIKNIYAQKLTLFHPPLRLMTFEEAAYHAPFFLETSPVLPFSVVECLIASPVT